MGKKERISYQGLLQCGPHHNFIKTWIFCLCGTTQAVDLSNCVPTFHLFLWKINRKQCVTCVIHLLIRGSVTFHSDEAFTSCGTPFCQACFRSADNMQHYCLCTTSHTKKKKKYPWCSKGLYELNMQVLSWKPPQLRQSSQQLVFCKIPDFLFISLFCSIRVFVPSFQCLF